MLVASIVLLATMSLGGAVVALFVTLSLFLSSGRLMAGQRKGADAPRGVTTTVGDAANVNDDVNTILNATRGVTQQPRGVQAPVRVSSHLQAAGQSVQLVSAGQCEAGCAESIIPGAGSQLAPSTMAPPSSQVAPSSDLSLASNVGGSRGGSSFAPAMIGDFFGGFVTYDISGLGGLTGGTLSIAGGDRRFKIAENVSPLPQDRVYYNFNYFTNALTDINGRAEALKRHTFGFEKTFWDRAVSFELRVPFAQGLNSDQTQFGSNNTNTEFGNIALALKGLLHQGRRHAISAGLSATLPTGDDFRRIEDFGFGRMVTQTVSNDAVHLAPFLGLFYQPNDLVFTQTFVQMDFDLNGNDVTDYFMNTPSFQGTIQDQSLLFIDSSVGVWLHRDESRPVLQAVAAMLELHYTTTMNNADSVSDITNPLNRVDVLNLTAGLVFQVRDTYVRVASAAPLRNDGEDLFDSEILVQVTRRY